MFNDIYFLEETLVTLYEGNLVGWKDVEMKKLNKMSDLEFAQPFRD